MSSLSCFQWIIFQKKDWKTITFRSLFLFIFVNFLGIRVQNTLSIILQTFTTSSSHPVLRAFGFSSSLPLLACVCISWCVNITCRSVEYHEYIGRMYSVTHVIVQQQQQKKNGPSLKKTLFQTPRWHL